MKYWIVMLVVLVASPLAAQDHRDIVAQVAAERPPTPSVEGVFDFTLRVLARLNELYPAERAGLLEKTAGENIVPYQGTLVSASRICYPNQRAFKLLTDVPNGNPQWADDGIVSVGGYMKGYLAVGSIVPPTPPPPTPPPPPSPGGLDLSGVKAQLDAIAAELHQTHLEVTTDASANDDAHKAINQNVTDGREENKRFFGLIEDHWKAITAVAAPFVTYATCHFSQVCK